MALAKVAHLFLLSKRKRKTFLFGVEIFTTPKHAKTFFSLQNLR
jgi:hypothetical protein